MVEKQKVILLMLKAVEHLLADSVHMRKAYAQQQVGLALTLKADIANTMILEKYLLNTKAELLVEILLMLKADRQQHLDCIHMQKDIIHQQKDKYRILKVNQLLQMEAIRTLKDIRHLHFKMLLMLKDS